ncbi:hypothetical protein ACFE04_031347 [Oxalis oulophora]
MTSDMELVPLTPQKRDPAWKHCQMFKSEDKLYLKCIHCFKIFKGGGIHRIKAHLACLKGNAATCLRVPVEVRLEMQQSLINSSGSSCKRRKKQGTSEETEKFDSMLREIELLPASNQSDVNDTLQDMGSPFTAEPISSLGVDGMINHGRDKRRKDGVGLTSPDGNIDDVSGLAEVKKFETFGQRGKTYNRPNHGLIYSNPGFREGTLIHEIDGMAFSCIIPSSSSWIFHDRYDNYRERNSMDPISFDCNCLVEDWIVCTEDFGSSDWMTLEQPYVSPMQLVADNDEVEDLGTGFDDLEIFNRVEEENVI